jgi:hypothetical protein
MHNGAGLLPSRTGRFLSKAAMSTLTSFVQLPTIHLYLATKCLTEGLLRAIYRPYI